MEMIVLQSCSPTVLRSCCHKAFYSLYSFSKLSPRLPLRGTASLFRYRGTSSFYSSGSLSHAVTFSFFMLSPGQSQGGKRLTTLQDAVIHYCTIKKMYLIHLNNSENIF